jgi:hypothetical protein
MMGLLRILLTEIPRASPARQREQAATRAAARPYREDSLLWIRTGPDDPETGLPKYPKKQTFWRQSACLKRAKTDNRSIMTTEQGSQTEREPRVAGKERPIGVRRGIRLLRHIAESAGRGTETAAT